MKISTPVAAILTAGLPLIAVFHGQIDLQVIRWSMQHEPSWLRTLCGFITRFGEATGWLVGALLLALYARYRLHNTPLIRRAQFFFIAVAVTGLAVLPLKWCFGKARPSRLFDDQLYGYSWCISPTDYGMQSFPSGHTTTAFAVATALALIAPRYTGLFLFGALLIGLSRIGVLCHYPSDIIAGAMLGSILTLLLFKCDRISFHFHRQDPQ